MAIRVGRGTKYDQPLTEPVRVLFTEKQIPVLTELAQKSGTADVSTWLREIALGERAHPNADHSETDGTVSLPILQDVPCGPFEEAIADNPSRLVFNGDWKRELGILDDDLLVYAHGQSMEGAHITDGALLVIERIPTHRRPPEGKPALIQIHYDGKAECTIKNYHTKNGKPLLRDGDGKEVKLPAHVEKLDVIGVVKRAILEF